MRELTLKEKIIYFFKDRKYYVNKSIYKTAAHTSCFDIDLDFPPSFYAKHTPKEIEEIRAKKLQEICDTLEGKNDV